jgi:exopolysaccharide biosynthesis polyprenyl glycosylphosphotransferase
LVTDLIPRVHLPIQRISESALFAFALSGAALYVLIFSVSGLYRIRRGDEWGSEVFLRIVSASFSWFLYFIALVYLSAGYVFSVEIPRLVIFFALFLSIIAVTVERFAFSHLRSALLEWGFLPKRRVLVLTATGVSPILEAVSRDSNCEIVAYANPERVGLLARQGKTYGKDRVVEACRKGEIDEILSLDSAFSREDLDEIFEIARTYAVIYRYADPFVLSESKKTEISFVSDVPVVEVVSIGLGPWGRIAKRTFDVAASTALIVAASPLLAASALAVFFSDGGTPIYRSVRVGRFGNLFFMYKFRSMRPDAEKLKPRLLSKNERKDGPLFKIENDPRITRVGAFLRRYDLDELPQLFNVLLGNMSLVGPRPHLPEEVGNYQESQKRVLTLKPGITGMAQVSGRHRNSFDEEVRLDLFYGENWSLFLDLKILFKTVSVVLSREGR